MRCALLALAVVAAIGLLVAACGGGDESGRTTTAVPDREGDAAILNQILSRQSAAIEAYRETLPALKGRVLALAELFRAQEQEHVDGLLEALRGLAEKAEPEPELIEAEGLRTGADHLHFFYEIESATIDAELSAVANLTSPAARTLLASTVANQAQHLVLLRRALGARPLATVPAPFETGTTPAP